MKNCFKLALAFMAGFFILAFPLRLKAHASEGDGYITISVDAVDSSGSLTYAIDTDEPSAFSPVNEFVIQEGTTHTIYVKDAAGNVTSQEYNPALTMQESDSTDYTYNQEMVDGVPQDSGISIDIELDNQKNRSNAGQAAGQGQGTVFDKVVTDTSTDADRIFYTVTTAEGEVFYLVIDQGQSSNNVYLLDQVKLSDLKELSIDDTAALKEEENSDSLLNALGGINNPGDGGNTEDITPLQESKPGSGSSGNVILLLVLLVVGGGVYYYMKIYKNKKEEQMDLIDAMDKEDFAVDDDEEDDEIDFGLSDDYQEEALKELFEEDEYEEAEESKDTFPENMPNEIRGGGIYEEEIYGDSNDEDEYGDEDDYDPEFDGEEE